MSSVIRLRNGVIEVVLLHGNRPFLAGPRSLPRLSRSASLTHHYGEAVQSNRNYAQLRIMRSCRCRRSRERNFAPVCAMAPFRQLHI